MSNEKYVYYIRHPMYGYIGGNETTYVLLMGAINTNATKWVGMVLEEVINKH